MTWSRVDEKKVWSLGYSMNKIDHMTVAGVTHWQGFKPVPKSYQ